MLKISSFNDIAITAIVVIISVVILLSGDVFCNKTPPSYFVQVDKEMQNMTKESNSTLRINCEITGHPIPTYTWYKDQRPMDKQHKTRRYMVQSTHWGSRLKIENLNSNDSGWYSCVATNHHDNRSTSAYLSVVPVGNLTGSARKQQSGSGKNKNKKLSGDEEEVEFEDGGYDYDDEPDDEDDVQYEIIYMENGDVDRYKGTTTKNQKKNQNRQKSKNKQDSSSRHFGAQCVVYSGEVCRPAFNNQTVRLSVVNGIGSHAFIDSRLAALHKEMISSSVDDLCTRIATAFLCRLSFRPCDGAAGLGSYVPGGGGGYYGHQEITPLCREDCKTFESEKCSSERELIRLTSLLGDYHNLMLRDSMCSHGMALDQPPPTCVWRTPKDDSSSASGQVHQMAYIGAVLVTTVLALCLVLIFLGRRRQQSKMKAKKQEHEMEASKRKALLLAKDHPAQSSSSTVSAPGGTFSTSAPVRSVSAVNVTFLYPIGNGHFGTVYAAQLTDQQNASLRHHQPLPVIAASLSEHADLNSKSRFDCEMRALSTLNPDHPNVLKCVAICSIGSPRSIIFEFVDGIDLKQNLLLLTSATPALDLATALDYSCQVARGFEYLAERNYYHGDLSARNVLVSRGADRNLRITNLGISRQIYESDYCVGSCGQILPLRWCPTERVLLAEASPATEIWSFGILLWEIFSGGTRPYSGLSDAQLLEEMNQGKQPVPQLPGTCPEDICRVIEECWYPEPAKRVNAATLRRNIEAASFRIFNNNVCLPNFNTLGTRMVFDGTAAPAPHYTYPFNFYTQVFPRASHPMIGTQQQINPATPSSNHVSSTTVISSPSRLNHAVVVPEQDEDDDECELNKRQYTC